MSKGLKPYPVHGTGFDLQEFARLALRVDKECTFAAISVMPAPGCPFEVTVTGLDINLSDIDLGDIDLGEALTSLTNDITDIKDCLEILKEDTEVTTCVDSQFSNIVKGTSAVTDVELTGGPFDGVNIYNGSDCDWICVEIKGLDTCGNNKIFIQPEREKFIKFGDAKVTSICWQTIAKGSVDPIPATKDTCIVIETSKTK